MIAVSASIKNAYNNYTTQRKPYIIVGNNTYYIQNMDLQADCYDEGNIIGNAIAKILKFDIETEYVEGLDEFELYDSIWTGNQYESVFLGTFKLYDEEGTDDYFSSVTAYDLLIKFNDQYDTSQMTYPSTVFGLLQNICNQAGVTLENTSIANGEQVLDHELFVEGETLKSILNAICQISGTFGTISNDKLRLLLKGTQTLTLQKYQISEPEFKRTTQNINQVVLGMTDIEGEEVKYPQDSQITGTIHKLTINDNPFVYTQALREAYIQNIYNQVNGFGYEAMSTKWEGLSYVELGDLLSADGHSSVVLRYNIKSPNGLDSTLEAPSIIDSVVKYYENSNSIENRQKRTEYSVDKANQRITQIVEEIGDRSEKSTSITQDIDSINQQVSQIETLTSDLTQNSSLTIEDAFEGEIVKFSISGNMSLLYPSDDLYPSNDLYPLDSYLIIQYEDETQDKIHLPLNYLRYLNATAYDEFVVENGQAKIIRRVGENDDGSFYALTSEIEEDKGNLIIALKEGYNKLWLESFFDLPLQYSARYVAQNDYTSLFATKVEMHSEISQTASEINLEVAKKVDENEVIAAINLTSETATIHANKLSLEGYTTINEGFSVDEEGNMIAKNGTFTGGLITLNDNSELVSQSGNFKISNESNGRYTQLNTMGMYVANPNGDKSGSYSQQGMELYLGDGTGYNSVWITQFMAGKGSYYVPGIMLSRQGVSEGASATQITSERILTPELTQNSLAEFKKNFEKLENALKIVEETDIYKYHFKSQKDDDKKHIGFIIGNDYNYSQEITSSKNDGVDLYSMIAVCFKAIQEQELKIKKLEAKWRS